MTDPILIAGAGPTGLTAALELARFGVPVRLIDRREEASTTSRAIGIQARTLELLGQRGLAEEMVRLGNPASGGSVYGGGGRLFRLDFSHLESRHNYLLLLSQAETERILGETLGRMGVAVGRGVELVGLAHDAPAGDSPVKVTLRHPDGRTEEATTPWLIDAEGAHSVVRTTIGLPFEGKSLAESYVLGDLHLDGDLPETDVHLFSSEHGLLAVFPMGRGRFRLIASHPFSRPEPGTAPTLGELQRIYDQRSPIPARLRDLVWGSWFRINSRMVPRLRVGRLILGGDSAHIHSPAGGQGMNTGIQDMINLGWKLALACRGEASPGLLDTYEQDRLPVIRDVLSNTERLTGLIGSENPIVRGLFNHLGPYVGGSWLVQEGGTSRMSQLALGYRQSPLSANEAHSGGLHAGDRVPDLLVRLGAGGEGRLIDALDPLRFTLLIAHGAGEGEGEGEESAGPNPGLREAAARWGDRARVVELAPPEGGADAARYRDALGRGSSRFLARPDGYVGLAVGAKSAAAGLDAYRVAWLRPA